MMRYVILLVISLLLSSCVESSKVDREKMMQDEIQRKLDKYRAVLYKKCKKEILEDAQLFVDSLVLIEFNELDTVAAPKRPTRPILEKKIILNDSVKIAPLTLE